MKRFALALVLAAGCTPETPMPGDQVLGTYAFTATPVAVDCALDDVPKAGFDFTGTFSRDSTSGQAWFRLNNILREASFDGAIATAVYSAPRTFGAACDGCTTELQESIVVALMSKSMNDAAGDACPEHPLDGGMPSGPEVTPPGPVAGGFDALRACGEMANGILATPNEGQSCDPSCGACRLHYSVAGARR